MEITDKLSQKYLEVDLIEYLDRFKSNFGELLNRPNLQHGPQTQIILDFVKEMIENLAGSWLKSQKNNLVICLFRSEEKNAYAFAHKNHEVHMLVFDERPWTLRQIWKAHHNHLPVFEIGLTTGLFDGTFNKDEIAFILAHELSHLMEGHLHDEIEYKSRSSFLSSQVNEITADVSAIDLMMGQYNPHACYTALEKIMTFDSIKNEEETKSRTESLLNKEYVYDNDIVEALYSGISTHHHPGVRLSTLQTYLKYLQFYGHWKPSPEHLEPVKFELDEDLQTEVTSPLTDEKRIERFFKKVKPLFFEYEILDPVSFGHFAGQDDYFNLRKSLNEEEIENVFQLFVTEMEAVESSSADTFLAFFLFSAWCYRELDAPLKKEDIEWNEKILKSLHCLSQNFEPLTLESKKPLVAMLMNSYKFLLQHTYSSIYCRFYTQWDADEKPELRNTYSHFLRMAIQYRIEKFTNSKDLSDLISYYDEIYGILQHNRKHSAPIYKVYLEMDAKLDLELTQTIIMSSPPSEKHVDLIRKIGGINQMIKGNEEEANQETLPALNSAASIYNHFKSLFCQWPLTTVQPGHTHQILVQFSHYSRCLEQFLIEKEDPDLTHFPQVLSQFNQCFHQSQMPRNPIDSDMEYHRHDGEVLAHYLNLKAESSEITDDDLKMMTLFFCMFDISKNLHINLQEDSKFKWKNYLNILNETQLMQLIGLHPRSLENGSATDDYSDLVVKLNFMLNGFQLFTAWIQEHYNQDSDLLKIEKSLTFRLMEIKALCHRMKQVDPYRYYTDSLILSRYTQKVFADLLSTMSDSSDFSNWIEIYLLAHEFGFNKSHFAESQYHKVSKFLHHQLSHQFSHTEVIIRLSEPKLRNLLHINEFTDLLINYIKKEVPLNDLLGLERSFRKLNNELSLDVLHLEVFLKFRNEIVKMYEVQPYQLEIIFPIDRRSKTERLVGFSIQVRYLSAICGIVRNREFEEQLAFINYVMGRTHSIPEWVNDVHDKILEHSLSRYGLIGPLLNFREDLQFRSIVERAFIINCMICGYGGLAIDPSGQTLLLSQLNASFPDEQKEIVNKVTEALIETDGKYVSLIFSYILAQSAKGEKITSTQMLGSLLESFGVPGQKMAQYLAFTHHFKDYYNSFKDFQDSVAPVEHFEILQLIQERFQGEWAKEKKIKKLIGSGTVNLAVLVEDQKLNLNQVVVIMRKGIENKTTLDFERFQKFVQNLEAKSDQKYSFAFVSGLVDIIKSSVEIEFDKENSSSMQSKAEKIYQNLPTQNTVATVPVYSTHEYAIITGEAEGITAKRMFEQDHALYCQLMKHVFNAEWAVLTSPLIRGNEVLTTLANPDLHDGQVLIHQKSAKIIDFGQVLEVDSNSLRDALVLTLSVSGYFEPEQVLTLLQKIKNKNIKSIQLQDVQNIFMHKEPMERFVHLISHLNKKGVKVSLPAIHWVLATHRLQQLSLKIEAQFEEKVTQLLMSDSPLLAEIYASRI